ncbi:hypothetical protein HYX16_01480 [Candidatus Woesearchaeota archaeon]|nr:hypothetical protein [Candidatus Woesearchaeota archaeon]
MEQVYGELFIFGQKNGEVKVFYVDGNRNRYITFEYDIFLKNKKTS